MNTQPTDRQRAQLHAHDDSDIVTTTARHIGFQGDLAYRRRAQDGRTYYALTVDGRLTGILTTAKGARATIAYWTSKGWTV